MRVHFGELSVPARSACPAMLLPLPAAGWLGALRRFLGGSCAAGLATWSPSCKRAGVAEQRQAPLKDLLFANPKLLELVSGEGWELGGQVCLS